MYKNTKIFVGSTGNKKINFVDQKYQNTCCLNINKNHYKFFTAQTEKRTISRTARKFGRTISDRMKFLQRNGSCFLNFDETKKKKRRWRERRKLHRKSNYYLLLLFSFLSGFILFKFHADRPSSRLLDRVVSAQRETWIGTG